MEKSELTQIARKLKQTFSGFDAPGYQTEIERFKKLYGDAESIRIGEMNYIVINEVYKSDEYNDIPRNTSPLFFNSFKNNFAIIDAQTSSILIDEVYSRITYMQRDCMSKANYPTDEAVKKSLMHLIGEGETVVNANHIEDVAENGSLSRNRANIFQCQLIKDTGVSASPDVYSFMLKGDQIKEVSDAALQRIQGAGTVSILDDTNIEELKGRKKAIQEAVFDKYINADMDIQSITVRSIFEIKMSYCPIYLTLSTNYGEEKLTSRYDSTFLTSETNEFDALNRTIHVCNCCGHDLVDARDEQKTFPLHTNMDAYNPEGTRIAEERLKKKNSKNTLQDYAVYSVGCEDCLTQCPSCHGWHFDYQKLAGSKIYDNTENFRLMEGREFIVGLRDFEDINYCSCRKGIDWIYDERSGNESEHDVIPVRDMVFINRANEKIAEAEEYMEYYEKEKDRVKPKPGTEERDLASQALNRFKNRLANRFEMNVNSISITNRSKCHECCICGGEYYGELDNDRCPVCTEMFDQNRHMVTRVDGVVFMLSGNKKNRIISKYIVTRLGNLKKISSKNVYDGISESSEGAAPDTAASV